MIAKTILKTLITAYAKIISPMMGGTCRFHPTCSAYGYQAIDRFGAIKGTVMTLIRILKCHPYYKGAYLDDVPPSIDWAGIIGYKRPHTQKPPQNTEEE